jgi:outer membrane protein TolC
MSIPAKTLIVGLSFILGSGLARAAEENSVLSLHDLIVAAVNTNLELSARRLDPAIQQNRLDGAKAAFDPTWVAGYSYSSTERPQNYEPSSVSGGATGRYAPLYEEYIARAQTGLTGRLPFGTQYELLTGVDRTSNTSIKAGGSLLSPAALYDPEYISTTTLTLTQPLLREFGLAANMAEIRLQRSTLKASKYDLTATALKIIRDTASAYYEMVFAQENIRVKEEAVAVAEALTRDNQRRLDEGRMAALDVTQAQSRVAEAREELILARNFLAQRRNTLRELTRDNFNFDEADFTVDPAFIVREAPAIARDSSLVTLFESNPTYLASAELVNGEKIRIAYAKNQNWPRVDLKASIGYNGLNDDPLAAYGDYDNRETPTYSVGLVVNVPIGNRAGKARLNEARNRKRQALLNLKRTEVILLSAFDTAQRDISSAAERTLLVKDSVKLAADGLDAQQRMLGSGKTTSYEVAQAQRDFSQARSRELATLVDLNKSIAQFQFVLGTLPEHLRINLDPAAE